MEIIIGAIAVCDYDMIVAGSANGYDFVSVLMDVRRRFNVLIFFIAFFAIDHACFRISTIREKPFTLY